MSQALQRSSIIELIAEMRRDPTASFRTDVAARRLGTSASNLIHAFTQTTGISPLRFRAALRIELAKRLLLELSSSVTDICFDVGYDSVGTFTRTFTAKVGLSPSRLRELAEMRPNGDLSGLPETKEYTGPEAGPETRVQIYVAADVLPLRAVVVAGLFRDGVPAGWPIDGRAAWGGSALQLAWPKKFGSASVLVAGVAAEPKGGVWRPQLDDLSVFAQRLRREASCEQSILQIHARLRRLRATDPPLLVALPLLVRASPDWSACSNKPGVSANDPTARA